MEHRDIALLTAGFISHNERWFLLQTWVAMYRFFLYVVFAAFTGLGFINVGFAGGHDQSSFEKESFTEDDFAQFFSLVKDGKIAAADISERCQEQSIGFTFMGADITHDQTRQRIFFNVSKEDASIDGRTLRAKHFNASFGEWTGSVFKPLCPGMYLLSVDYNIAGRAKNKTELAIYLRRHADDEFVERPGKRVISSKNGHFTLALPLHSLDEISVWSESARQRTLQQVTLTGVKVQHLEEYVADVNMDQYSKDIMLLKRTSKD